MRAPPQGIDPGIINEAAEWLMRLHDESATAADHEGFAQWCQRSPEHARAGERSARLMGRLESLPNELAKLVLDRARPNQRRAAVARMVMGLAAIPAGLGAWHLAEDQGWAADERTAIGERRELQLADGSRLTLNTASAIDLRMDAHQRHITLRAGELLVQSLAEMARPLLITTAEGVIETLGQRLNVRQGRGRTHVSVIRGSARIRPQRLRGDTALWLRAGQSSSFNTAELARPQSNLGEDPDWTQGMLVADEMRLEDVAAELDRYRVGVLHCDAAIAGLRVSGAFPITDTDRALSMLAATYPVRVLRRARGLWVSLVSR